MTIKRTVSDQRSAISLPRAAASSRRVRTSTFTLRTRDEDVAARGAFSLIEVLLAIFILGVGVISIAALFPAGIAQQRLSVDDMMGKTVADSAIEIIRNKVKADDFGTFEEFDDPAIPTPLAPPRPTAQGDWSWLRPGFLFGNDPETVTAPPTNAGTTPPPVDYDDTGSIDIFSQYYYAAAPGIPTNQRASEFHTGLPGSSPALFGIPFNRVKYGNVPPRIIITQRERYYPAAPQMYVGTSESSRPQYVWDCMFRRFQGKIFVTIFVYRVTMPGGGSAANYKIAPNGNVPPLPIWLNFVNATGGDANTDVSAGGPWDTGLGLDASPVPENRAIVLGTEDGMQYNPDDARQAWQQPRQWIVDQNNNIHRVTGQTRENMEQDVGDMEIELSRPLSPVRGRADSAGTVGPWTGPFLWSPTPTHFYYRPSHDPPTSAVDYTWVHDDIVTDIWYLPLADTNGLILTPIYAAVKEL